MKRSMPVTILVLVAVLGAQCQRQKVALAAGATDADPRVLYLHTEFFPYQVAAEETLSHPLGRELCRQALLIAARNELGLMTRDETLGEVPPDEVQVMHLLLTERATQVGKWRLRLFAVDSQGASNSTPPLWEATYDVDPDATRIYADLVPKLERDSRGAMVEALHAAGLHDHRANTASDEITEMESVEQSLQNVDYVKQFGAVRMAHAACENAGETPDRLAILVRAYANLGALTQHHWNSASDVFTARSWLYAQRAISRNDGGEAARWNRGYAWALGGVFHLALEDLQPFTDQSAREANLDRTSAGEDVHAAQPLQFAWSRLLDAYCRYDRAKVKAIIAQVDTLRPWGTYLHYRLTSDFRYSPWMYRAGEEVARVCPAAYGVYADMAQNGQTLRTTRSGAYWAPLAFAHFAPQSIRELPGIAPAIVALLDDNPLSRSLLMEFAQDPNPRDWFSAIPVGIARELRRTSRADGTGEPSWSVLGSMLLEEQFVQAAHYMKVAKNATESPLSESTDALMPLIREHRYAPYVDSLRYNPRREETQSHAALAQLRVIDPRRNMSSMLYDAWNLPDEKGGRIGKDAYHAARHNFTVPGLIDQMYTIGNNWDSEVDKFDLEYSRLAPQSEVGLRLIIYLAKQPTSAQMQRWETQIKEDPAALTYLGNHYRRSGDAEAAIRCYTKSLQLLPTLWATRMLATLYSSRGDMEKWEQTLHEFLKSEDFGLQHAQVHSWLLYSYIRRGEWQKAKPHAEQCGQTWSGRGLDDASHVCEGLAQWDESERWICELSTSYPSYSGDEWYFWCKRTGRGDLHSAEKLADTFHAVTITRPTRDNQVRRGAYFVLKGDAQEALAAYEAALSIQPTTTCACMVAQLSRDLGDEGTRKQVLTAQRTFVIEQIAKRKDLATHQAGLALLELLIDADASAEKVMAIDALLCATVPNTRCAYACILARELDALGQPELAQAYWRKSLVIPINDPNYSTLSGMELSQRNKTSRPDDDQLAGEDLWPARTSREPSTATTTSQPER